MYKKGQIIEVKAASVVKFGVFCQLPEEGVTGLIHISEISDFYVANISDYIKVLDTIKVEILDYDPEKKQAKLSYKSIRPELLKTYKKVDTFENDKLNKIR